MRSDGSLHAIRSFYPQSARLLPLSLFPLISHPAQDPPGEVSRPKGRRIQNRGRCVSYTSSQMSRSARACRRPCLCYFWGVERPGLGPFTPPLSPSLSLSFSRCTTSVDDTIYHFHVLLSNTPLLVVAPLRRPPLLKERSGRAALPLVGKRRGRSRYCFKKESSKSFGCCSQPSHPKNTSTAGLYPPSPPPSTPANK